MEVFERYFENHYENITDTDFEYFYGYASDGVEYFILNVDFYGIVKDSNNYHIYTSKNLNIPKFGSLGIFNMVDEEPMTQVHR